MGEANEYVLTTSDAELERLGFQHRVWSASAMALWERAGVRPGCSVLDVGCGPGYAAFDLAQLVGREGRVVGVDQSERFIESLRAERQTRGLPQIEARVGDVQDFEIEASAFDQAWIRWVLCFVPDPAAVVTRVHRALKPGGMFAIHDYFSYETVALGPKAEAFDHVIAAVAKSFRAGGGDPDVGGRLPGLLERAGFEVLELNPIVRIARPGSLLWQWPVTFFRLFLTVLEVGRYITADEAQAFRDVTAQRERDGEGFLMTPPVVEILARKR